MKTPVDMRLIRGTAGVTRKPNKEILEHDRKRQIQLKLVILEDKLIDQGYIDAEIAEKLDEARNKLEAEAADEDSDGPIPVSVSEKKFSDAQTHQIAARKEKQMETLKAALGITSAEANEMHVEENDDAARAGLKNGTDGDDKNHRKREHTFLDRDFTRKKQMIEGQKVENDDKKGIKESRRIKEGDSEKRKQKDDSSDSDSSREMEKSGRRRHHKGKRGSDDEYDSDCDAKKMAEVSKKKISNHRRHKRGKGRESDDSDSESGSDSYSSDDARKRKDKFKKAHRRHHSDDDDDVLEGKKRSARRNQKQRKRHDSDDDSECGSDSDSSDDSRKRKDKLKKAHRRHDLDDVLEEERGSQKQRKRDDSDDDSDTDESDSSSGSGSGSGSDSDSGSPDNRYKSSRKREIVSRKRSQQSEEAYDRSSGPNVKGYGVEEKKFRFDGKGKNGPNTFVEGSNSGSQEKARSKNKHEGLEKLSKPEPESKSRMFNHNGERDGYSKRERFGGHGGIVEHRSRKYGREGESRVRKHEQDDHDLEERKHAARDEEDCRERKHDERKYTRGKRRG